MDQNQRRAAAINARKGKPLPHIRTVPAQSGTAYFIESRPHSNAPWQRASGVNASWESKDKALERLTARREMQSSWEHRLMERITTVTEQPATED